MSNCNIRKVDAALMRAVKMEAAKKGITLREWMIDLMRKAVSNPEAPSVVSPTELLRQAMTGKLLGADKTRRS